MAQVFGEAGVDSEAAWRAVMGQLGGQLPK